MKIYSREKDYTGVSASVPFCNGCGETDDPHLIDWFRTHGYTVNEPAEVLVEKPAEEPVEEPVEEPPKKAAKSKGA